MYYILYTLNGLLMIAMPLALGRTLAAWRKVSWSLFAMGAATFILSQVGHIPFNLVVLPIINRTVANLSTNSQLLITAIFLGLSAGLFEETARYLTYRYWATDARTWSRGMMLGAGHGGSEAIVTGLLFLINFVTWALIYRGVYQPTIPPEFQEQWDIQLQTIQAFFSAPWYDTLLGALERLFAIFFHLSASLLVMQTFVRRQWFWLPAAILWHTLLNAVAVYAFSTWGPYVAEGLVGLLVLGALFIIYRLHQPDPAELPPPEPLPTAGPAEPMEMAVTAESLDRSRYQ